MHNNNDWNKWVLNIPEAAVDGIQQNGVQTTDNLLLVLA